MNKILLIALFFSISAKCADVERQPAKITKVTVFQNQAQITSTIKGSLGLGNNTIIIENVSPQLNPQSIQIAGKGDIVIMGTKYNNNFMAGAKSSLKLQQLNDSLKIINEYLKMINFNQDAFDREKDLLKANYNTAATTVANTADKVKAMADFFRARMADINMNIIKNERVIYNLKEKLTKIQSQISDQNINKNQPSGEITVLVLAKSKTNYELELTYIVGGAGWSPVYDIRVKDTKSAIDLYYKAKVWQQTGLDWNDVKISLSTANPSEGGTKPELQPQIVDFYLAPQPQYTKRSSKAMISADEVAVQGATMAEEMVVSTAKYTSVAENVLAVNFDISLSYTIQNGGSPQMVDIQQHSLKGNFKHFAIPKYDIDAFLTSQIVGWEQYNLLPGNANVYFDGAFVGEAYIADNQTTDTLNLSLGRDKKINIKRELMKDYSSKKTIGTNIREAKAYKITVRNTKKEEVDLMLEDQLPISANSDIEILDAEYKGAELEPETGKLNWKLNLKPNETKILELKYIIKYPKGKVIVGG